jgi:hypothetical protein
MPSSDDTFSEKDEHAVELAYWQHRALEAERLRDLDREYIEDLYHLRDIENGWVR